MNKSDIFNDKTKQLKLLNKFPPGFIKFDNDGKIEINRTVKLNIPLENMTFSSTTKFNRQTIHNENSYLHYSDHCWAMHHMCCIFRNQPIVSHCLVQNIVV